MKPYALNPKPAYRFALFLAIVFHLVLFSALFLSLRFAKPLFLTASVPLAVIQATAVASPAVAQPTALEKENPKPPSKPKPVLVKPTLIEKSPVALPVKEKKVVKKRINPIPLQKKPLAKREQPKLLQKLKHPEPSEPRLSAKSLQLAQKNVQQLLQQELNTTVQKNQRLARNAAATTKYRHLILQSIAQQWIIPPHIDKHLETRLAVHLAPGGMVLDVTIIKGSGNPVLDRSAQTAVYKASPLPVPKEGDLFNNFRQINLTVRPEALMS